MKINNISTEGQNIETIDIDRVSNIKKIRLINNQDKKVAIAVEGAMVEIAKAVDSTTYSVNNGGRIFYIGAGTSGRLGILDASEILPTYGESEIFIGIIAGGKKAIESPVENAEDNIQFAIDDLKKYNLTNKDVVIGIAASGRTPYVISALKYASSVGAETISISTSKDAKISKIANISIEAVVGPETIVGSTRMKSGTAQKMILNIISTITMTNYGKVYKNFMVDMVATNEKLKIRAKNMLSNIIGISENESEKLLKKSNGSVKIAVAMYKNNISYDSAKKLLEENQNSLRKIINE